MRHNSIFAEPYEKYWRNVTTPVHEMLVAELAWFQTLPVGRRVLELGAGDGRMTSSLRRIGQVVSLDIEEAQIVAARRRLPEDSKNFFVQGNALALPWKLPEFDMITLCWNFLGMVPAASMVQLLSEAFRVVKPGGIVAGCVYGETAAEHQGDLYNLWGFAEPFSHPDPFVTARTNPEGRTFASRRFSETHLKDIGAEAGANLHVSPLSPTTWATKYWGKKS